MTKKRAAIFGAGNAGRYLYDELKGNSSEYEIYAFLDNNVDGEYKGTKIVKPDSFLAKESVDVIFIAAGAQKTLKIMIDTCRKFGLTELFMVHDIAAKCRLPLFDQGEFVSRWIRRLRFSNERPSIAYFEVPITDNCNLNCKGCLFASNITQGTSHVRLEDIKKDAKKMSELFYDVPWIRILGGEPLMHPDIVEILKYYRKCFGDTEIDLCTNGLLIPKMSKEFWECIKREHISIHVSGYKPTYNMLNKIDETLKKEGIPYVILKRESFSKYYTEHGDNNMQKSYAKCMSSGCYELYRGQLSACSAVIAFERFNKYFGTSYSLVKNEDWFDIYDSQINSWDIVKKMSEPSNKCRYCSEDKTENFQWDYSNEKVVLDDFIIKDRS